ncbi:MAG: hypothetical protein KAH24_07505 [Holophagae bacterium]|nr:hypothetical protein [Holophagae bacterium]
MKMLNVRAVPTTFARLLPVVLVFFLVMTQLAAIGDGFHNTVLCIEPGDHVAVEIAAHTVCHTSNPDDCPVMSHSHSSKPCTDIPLPGTDPFLRGQNIARVAPAQMGTALPFMKMANREQMSFCSRPMMRRTAVQTGSAIPTVILRI